MVVPGSHVEGLMDRRCVGHLDQPTPCIQGTPFPPTTHIATQLNHPSPTDKSVISFNTSCRVLNVSNNWHKEKFMVLLEFEGVRPYTQQTSMLLVTSGSIATSN